MDVPAHDPTGRIDKDILEHVLEITHGIASRHGSPIISCFELHQVAHTDCKGNQRNFIKREVRRLIPFSDLKMKLNKSLVDTLVNSVNPQAHDA